MSREHDKGYEGVQLGTTTHKFNLTNRKKNIFVRSHLKKWKGYGILFLNKSTPKNTPMQSVWGLYIQIVFIHSFKTTNNYCPTINHFMPLITHTALLKPSNSISDLSRKYIKYKLKGSLELLLQSIYIIHVYSYLFVFVSSL